MKFTDFINKVLFSVSVPRCVGCGIRLKEAGSPLCPECYSEYLNAKTRNCSLCSNKLSECTCTNMYLKKHYIHRLIKVYRYVYSEKLPSNLLIYSLKRDNRHDVIEFLASELANAIKNSVSPQKDFIITYVPRRKSAIRKYGIDHSMQLAYELSRLLGTEFASVLISNAKAPQKKLTAKERAENASYTLKPQHPELKGKTVILVDDIVTTGSSMGACARLLHSLGAKKIIGACISIAYRDRCVRFERGDRFTLRK